MERGHSAAVQLGLLAEDGGFLPTPKQAAGETLPIRSFLGASRESPPVFPGATRTS